MAKVTRALDIYGSGNKGTRHLWIRELGHKASMAQETRALGIYGSETRALGIYGSGN